MPKNELTIKLDSLQAVSTALDLVSKIDPGSGREIVIRKFKKKRSLDQNALYWMWLTALAKYFASKGQMNDRDEPINQDDMHDLMRHKFLGHVEVKKTLGRTEIFEYKLKSTTVLDKGEMTHYLTQIDQWAVEHGCTLPHPEDCEYEQLIRQQVA